MTCKFFKMKRLDLNIPAPLPIPDDTDYVPYVAPTAEAVVYQYKSTEEEIGTEPDPRLVDDEGWEYQGHCIRHRDDEEATPFRRVRWRRAVTLSLSP